MDTSSPIQYIKGVGPQRAALLSRLGITTVRDALFHLPSRYEDRGNLKKIVQLRWGETGTVMGTVSKAEVVPASPRRPRLKIFSLVVTDGSGALNAKWFNQPYLKNVFKPGQKVVLHGPVKANYWGAGFEMLGPEFEISDDESDEAAGIHTGRIVPVYPLTEGLSQRQVRTMIHSVVTSTVGMLSDPLPPGIRERLGLTDLRESVQHVHFPPAGSSMDALARGASRYHQRLAFDELFSLQLGLAALKGRETAEKGIPFRHKKSLTARFMKLLPFSLTGAQQRVISDILSDVARPTPMHRLVQGDVGSGKTVVAIMAMLVAVENGCQAALMAPTEILAEQHYLNLRRMAESLGISIRLLTGSVKGRDADATSVVDADLIIGTHALIQERVVFRKLGLIVIDEQHRFGVLQRAHLRRKGENPHTLIMTATPIPRTLALTLYGDLDYSLIDELPPTRTPVTTKVYREQQKDSVYRLMLDETKKGRQVYVVYPVIEESEKTNLKDAINGAEALRKKFPHLSVGLLHGRMKPDERENVMKTFKEGGIHVLVATTVIEVGIDVPNATLMVIIHAERFGLAQLHQLRGRVGRGADRSFCILLNYGGSEDSRRRLDVMARTTDGFVIAEEDLAIRGPGEFFGTRQSGLPDLKAANLLRDQKLLELARKEAFALVAADPFLESFPRLRSSIEDFWGKKVELFKTA